MLLKMIVNVRYNGTMIVKVKSSHQADTHVEVVLKYSRGKKVLHDLGRDNMMSRMGLKMFQGEKV